MSKPTPCHCEAYPFPHRVHGGECKHHVPAYPGEDRMHALVRHQAQAMLIVVCQMRREAEKMEAV
jgi:hypothetical protein